MHSVYYKFLGPISDFAAQNEYLGIFLLLFLSVLAIPLPVEGILLFVGYRINQGVIDFLPALCVAILAGVTATTLGYGIGRFISIAFQNKLHSFFRISQEKREYVSSWFRQVDEWGPIFGYFLPIFRHFIGPIAGVSKFQFFKFITFSLLGACVWSFTFLSIGQNASKHWHRFSRTIQHPLFVLGGIVIVIILGNLWIHLRKKDPKI